jgi:hypothetical protein
MKQQAANFAPQGAKPSVIAEILQAKNISKLKGILKAMEAEEMERADKQAQAENSIEQRKIEIEKEYKEIEYTFDSMLQKEKIEGQKEIENIKGQYQLADTNTPGDALDPLALEEQMLVRQELAHKAGESREKLNIEREKLRSQEKIAKEKTEAERYKADKGLQQAKITKSNRPTSKSTPKKK